MGSVLDKIFWESWEAVDERPISEWAAEHVKLPHSVRQPDFSYEVAYYLKEPLDTLADNAIREQTVMAANQSAKSTIAEAYLCWRVCHKLGMIMYTMQTEDDMKDAAESRIHPMLEETKPTAARLPCDKSKKRTKAIQLRGKPLFMQGANKNRAQSKSATCLINSELHAWQRGLLAEFKKRITAARNAKCFTESTGGVKGDDLDTAFHEGDQREWHFKCPKCKRYQPWKWEYKDKEHGGMRWDKNAKLPSGDWNIPEVLDSIYYECAFDDCRHHIKDEPTVRRQLNVTGKYIAMNPNPVPGKVSFHWNAMAVEWIPWTVLVVEFLAACKAKKSGSLILLKEFVQKRLGESWDDSGKQETEPASIIYMDYAPRLWLKTPWADERFRFFTLDAQKNLLEFWGVIRAWSANESRRVWRGRITTFEEIAEIQKYWGVKSRFVAIDSGYQATKIYRECCRHVDETGRGWIAMKGDDREFFTHHFSQGKSERRIYAEKSYGDPALGMKNEDTQRWLAGASPHALELYKKGQLKCPLYLWSNPSVKDILVNHRDGAAAPWLAPEEDRNDPMEQLYCRHLNGEVKRKEINARGQEVDKYVEVGPNHMMDAECEQIVCATMAGVLKV